MKRTTPNLAKRLDAHFLACTAAVGAAAAFAPSQEAKAAIVYVDLSGTPIIIPLTTAGIYLNVVTGIFNVAPAAAPGWDVNPYSASGLSWFGASPAASSGYIMNLGSSATLVDNLSLGSLIGSGFTFGTNNGSETTGATAFNFNSDNNFVGFRFLNEVTGLLSFGFLQIHLGATLTDPTRSIIGYAYEDSGGSISAGTVPEPSTYATLGLMALGAFGVRLWKRSARSA